MQKYEMPELEVIQLHEEDVITTSVDIVTPELGD